MAKAKLTTRAISSTTVTSDNLAKGSQLTHNQLDSNFLNLRDATFGVVADDSSTIQIGMDNTLYVQGAGGISTSTDSAGVLTIDASSIASSSLGDLTAVGSTLSSPSNADITLDPSGTGLVVVNTNLTVGNNNTQRFLGNIQQHSAGDNLQLSTTAHGSFPAGSGIQIAAREGTQVYGRFEVTTGTAAATNFQDGLIRTDSIEIGGGTCIISGRRSNEDLSLQPAGTGNLILGAVKLNGTTLSSDDSTKITVAEAVDVTGALVAGTSLNIAGDGATVTGILDEDAMGSDSNVKLATQQSIKAYVDAQDANIASDTLTLTNKTFDAEGTGNSLSNVDVANLKSGVLDTDISSVSGSDDTLASAKAIKTYVDSQISGVATGQGFKVVGDDSASVDIPEGGTVYIQGGTNVTTATDSAGVVTINATGEVTASSTTTFTNKTFDAEGTGNSLSNVDVANLKSGVLDTDISSVSGSDDTLASAKAIKTYVDSQVSGVAAGQGFKVIGDDSAGVDIPEAGTLYIQGGTNVTTSTDSAGVVTINASAGGSGDITSVVAGDGLTGGATTGDATLNIGAGTGIDVAADAISVDVSDFMTNGSDNRVVTATGTDAMNGEANLTFDGSILGVSGTQTITNTTTNDSLTITTTEDSSTAAPVITLKRNSGSPADADYLGQLKFKGENDADQEVNYAKITGKISDASDSSEDGLIEFALMKAGSNNIGARLNSTNLQLLNGTGLESNGNISSDGSITAGTSIGNDAITIDDHTITTTRSNDDLFLTANGTGRVVMAGDSDLDSLPGNNNRNLIFYKDHAVAFGSRHYTNQIVQDLKIDSGQSDSTSSNDRFRNVMEISLDLNGKDSTNTSSLLTRGPQNGLFTNVKNSASGDSTLGNANAGQNALFATTTGSGDLTITDSAAHSSSIETNAASGTTITFTDAYGYHSSGVVAEGSGTTTVTDFTHFYAQTNASAGSITNEFGFVTEDASIKNSIGGVDLQNGTITTDGISIVDNEISATRSNDDLEISANGTGFVNISSDGTFSSQASSSFANNFGDVSTRCRGVHIFRKETIGSALTSSSDRRQGHLIGQEYILGNYSSSDKDNRYRTQTVGCVVDLNGATVNSTNSFAGAMAAQGQVAVHNTDASNAGTIGNSIGMMAGSYHYSTQTVNVTNAHGVFSYVEQDDDGGAVTITNAFAYKAQLNKYAGTMTNGYAYYVDTNGATNKFAFYDNTASLSRFGAVILANVSDPSGVTDSSHIYAKDDGGSSEVHVRDEAGNITKISPHNEKGEWEYFSRNIKTGKTVRVNMERMIRKLEEVTGETFIETV